MSSTVVVSKYPRSNLDRDIVPVRVVKAITRSAWVEALYSPSAPFAVTLPLSDNEAFEELLCLFPLHRIIESFEVSYIGRIEESEENVFHKTTLVASREERELHGLNEARQYSQCRDSGVKDDGQITHHGPDGSGEGKFSVFGISNKLRSILENASSDFEGGEIPNFPTCLGEVRPVIARVLTVVCAQYLQIASPHF